jgi:hypothetical protein
MKTNRKDIMVVVIDEHNEYYGETGRIVKRIRMGQPYPLFAIKVNGCNILLDKGQFEYAAPWSCERNDVVEFSLGHSKKTRKLGVVNRRLTSTLAEILSDDGALFTLHVKGLKIVGRQIENTFHYKILEKMKKRREHERRTFLLAAAKASVPQSKRGGGVKKTKTVKTRTVGDLTFTY